MRWQAGLMAFVLLGCGEPADSGPAEGQACGEDARCAAGLSCVRLVCRDERGPQVQLSSPEPLATYASDVLTLSVDATLTDLASDDRLVLSLTPAIEAFLGQDAIIDGDAATAIIDFVDYIPSGPYHLRAQVTDAGGQAHPNPGALAEHVLFVRDATIPDTPQVAIVWPPAGYEHPAGVDLEIEVAVLPGSFAFTDGSNVDDCQPVNGCEPAFAPECEDECGPVTREGHVKIYREPDYPGCLLDTPIGCNGEYIVALRPSLGGTVEGSTISGVISGQLIDEPGPITLHAALSYAYHDPYPSAESVIHESIAIRLVE